MGKGFEELRKALAEPVQVVVPLSDQAKRWIALEGLERCLGAVSGGVPDALAAGREVMNGVEAACGYGSSTMWVILAHSPNPDIWGGIGYWGHPVDPPVMLTLAPSVEAAQAACVAYCERNALGGGNWCGGQVFKSGARIGRVSYNGRYWPVGGEA